MRLRPTADAALVRADIQGLRALAVALVIMDHVGLPGLGGGYIGVDVFFVVSGFLITGLLLREHDAQRRISIAGFYARRARRILPAATVVLVATSWYAASVLSVSRLHEVLTDARWSAAFAANWHFSRLGTDYFAQGREPSPFQHFWSLAVEEQFYIVWPGLLALLLVVGRRSRGPAVVALGVVWAASFAFAVVTLPLSPTAAYFSSFSRAWELASGALLAVVAGRLGRIPGWLRHALGALGVTAIGVAATSFGDTTAVPGLPALLPVAGTVAVLAAGIEDRRGIATRALGFAPMVRAGDASYSLYLWHWPVLIFGSERLTLAPAGEAVVLVVVTVTLALSSYLLVEQPFRGRSGLLARRRRGLVLWPAALALVLVSGAFADARGTAALERSREQARQFYSEYDPPVPAPADGAAVDPITELRNELRAALALAEDHAPIPDPLVNLDGLDQDHWGHAGCRAEGVETHHELCPAGALHAHTIVAVLGDSQMGQWMPAFDVAGRRGGFRVIPFIKNGCPAYDVKKWVGGYEFWQCRAFHDWALAEMARLRPAAVVVTGRSEFERLITDPDRGLEETWTAGVERRLRQLQEITPAVLVLGELAAWDREPADCLTDPDSRLDSCLIPQTTQISHTNALLKSIAERLGMNYADPVPLNCLADRCPLVVVGIVTRKDFGHLSRTWVQKIARAFSQMLDLPCTLSLPSCRRRSHR